MLKIIHTDRSAELLEDGSIKIEYDLTHRSDLDPLIETGQVVGAEFFYSNFDDMKNDRDLFNEFLEAAGY